MVNSYFVHINDIKPENFGDEEGFKGVDSRLVLADTTVGSEKACLFRVIFPKGAFHGPHCHTKSDEFLYALRGKAIQWIAGKEYIMTPGSAMILPKNEIHWMRNDWEEPFEVIGFYPDVPNFYLTDQQVADDWEKYGFSVKKK